MSYKARLRELSLDTLELRRLRFDLLTVYKIINGLVDLPFEEFFSVPGYVNTRGTSFKLFKPRSNMTLRSKYFCIRVINCWNSLPEDVVFANSVASFNYMLKRTDISRFLSGFI